MESTRLDDSHCGKCGHVLDAATAVDGGDYSPKENDLTVCVYCGEMHQFDADLKLHPLTEEQKVAIQEDAPETWEILSNAQAHIRADLNAKA